MEIEGSGINVGRGGKSVNIASKRYKKRRKKVHQTTNMKISSMHTSRQQQNTFQQNLKLNIESHGKL